MRIELTKLLCMTAVAIFASAAPVATNGAERDHSLWTRINKTSGDREFAIGAKYITFSVNSRMLREILESAPMEFSRSDAEGVIFEIPTPDGGFEKFRLEESPMLSPEVAKQFPAWKTYQARGIDDPTASARFDINANGFHGYVVGAKGTYLIDPYSRTEQNEFIVYYKGALSPNRDPFSCGFHGEVKQPRTTLLDYTPTGLFDNGTQLRTFKLAVSASKQYTTFFTTQTAAFAAIQTTINRMNLVYRRELSVTFTIVSDLRTVFTTANDGGFTNNSTNDLARNQTVLDQTYGAANYDIGHVLSQTPNPDGVAVSPSLCDPTVKAQGFTGAPTPQNDGYDVDYVAHEIGHQFSMSHTFNNGTDGSCTTRAENTAFEPASGVTIMGYGGICAPRNLSANSIEYFHNGSLEQAVTQLASVTTSFPTCGTTTATNNTPPTISGVQATYNIPRLTPFTLSASATDAQNDALTYSWEEADLGGATGSAGAGDTDGDGVARPIFRSYNPSTAASRTFPSLPYILNNRNAPSFTYQGSLPNAPTAGSTNGYVCAAGENCVVGESLPTMGRAMNFRLTVRDNNPNGGGVAEVRTVVNVFGATERFWVTVQNGSRLSAPDDTWQGNSRQTVTWTVGATNTSPINTANVKISFSTDGGQTFPYVVAESTPNDGTEVITVPNVPTTRARIKVEAVGNIFFDINDVNFPITAAPAKVRSDFDGDGRSDLAVFRNSEANWYVNGSTAGFSVTSFGLPGDTIVPGDFDGDRQADIAIFRPAGDPAISDFLVLRSSDSTVGGTSWGVPNDIPAIADYDGDGKDDFAIWRPSAGDFYVLNSQNASLRHYSFGLSGDIPVVADYDGDGKADFAMFRPSTGIWYVANSSNGAISAVNWGMNNDIPVPVDFDGDRKADRAVFRPSDGIWYMQLSAGGTNYVPFGMNGDVPVPGDFDGDGKNDPAVYRNGVWYENRSTSGFAVENFGLAADRPTLAVSMPKGR